MKALKFLVGVIATETVAGVGLGVSSERIRDTLGEQYVADRRKKSLRLDYGLLEFGLYADVCETISIQVHRLFGGTQGLVPEVLEDAFSGFSRSIRFESLCNEVERTEIYTLAEVVKQQGYRCYRVGNSSVIIYVVDEVASDSDHFSRGDVWSVVISRRG
ncbi:hypothetical protein SK803_15730 [Lentzea sp. BCCO 10_0856]|uniref:Uncharacterized protein n=1 Tax=Lentzea miocenica TaxID=3095431 RepID=A0ABU4T0Q5_9PSEU|nr:hypothetical protein [Lentzea sp. BCCO 10_0856]MDX8031675.1 hypothetical protein [Lentzea sp. BCCO 10_0856]